MSTKQKIIHIANGTAVRVTVRTRPNGKDLEYIPVPEQVHLNGEVAWKLVSLGNRAVVSKENGEIKTIVYL